MELNCAAPFIPRQQFVQDRRNSEWLFYFKTAVPLLKDSKKDVLFFLPL